MAKNDRRRVKKARGAKAGSARDADESSGAGGGLLMSMRGGFKNAAGAATGAPKSKVGDILMWVVTAVVAAVAVFVLARRFGLFHDEPATGSPAGVPGTIDLRAGAGPVATGMVGPTAAPAPAATTTPAAPPLAGTAAPVSPSAATAAEATPGSK